jgi:DNA-binding response OmpR family regulator
MGNKRILIVDDDADFLRGMHLRLKANNYDTFFATDAVTSISEARKCEPDLILLDLGLPAGDGFIVMERLKAVPSLSLIPIVVLSGRDIRENRIRALKAGASAFLQKPANDADVLLVLRQALGEPAESTKPVVYDLGWCRGASIS